VRHLSNVRCRTDGLKSFHMATDGFAPRREKAGFTTALPMCFKW